MARYWMYVSVTYRQSGLLTVEQLTLFTLEHASSSELLTAVIRTLRQHTEVWACMDRTQSISSALFAAHTVWKTRGVQSRPLLNLLIELDDGRLLEQTAREQVLADHTAFAYVSRCQYCNAPIFTCDRLYIQ